MKPSVGLTCGFKNGESAKLTGWLYRGSSSTAELQIIEMTLVHPPFLLDFGKAYIDEPSPYTPEQLKEWHPQWRQYFPKQDIPRVHKVLGILKG